MLLKEIRNRMDYYLKNNKIINKGKNNRIEKDWSSRFRYTRIEIRGNNNTLIFGPNCALTGARIQIYGDNNRLEFGHHGVVNASESHPTVLSVEGGRTLKVGNYSGFSNSVQVHTSDYHGIYDIDGNRFNFEKDVILGDHVWIGLGVILLKGVEIPDGCIVGAGSVLAGKKYTTPNSIIAGNPGKVIKTNVIWRLKRKDHINFEEEEW